MPDSAVQTLAAPPQTNAQAVEPKAVLAPISIRDEDGESSLFTNALRPRGEVSFGSNVENMEVEFHDESPLIDLPKKFFVAHGPAITATVQNGASGRFLFDLTLVASGTKFSGLVLDVADKPKESEIFRVGYLVELEGLVEQVRLQVFVKPGRRLVDALFENFTAATQDLKVTRTQLDPERVTLAAGESKSQPFKPLALGMAMDIRLESKDYKDTSGGIQQADIIVEPPP